VSPRARWSLGLCGWLAACGADEKAGLDVIPCVDLSPDAQVEKLVFAAKDSEGDDRIFRVDRGGGGLCRMGEPPKDSEAGWERAPAWSADSAAVALAADLDLGPGIYRADPEGQGRLLVQAGELDDPAWSPSGGNLWASQRLPSGGSELVRFAAGGGSLRLETETGADGDAHRRPAPHPDGGSVAFEGERSGVAGVWLLQLDADDGLNAPALLLEGATAPAWRADGRALAFGWRGGVATAPFIDGALGPVQPVEGLSDATVGPPTWSADGDRLGFSTDLLGLEDLFSATPEGDALQQLTNGPGDKSEPDWSRSALGG